jgi:hypothetical protein
MTVGFVEIAQRFAKILGLIVYKLSKYDLHLAYKEKFI